MVLNRKIPPFFAAATLVASACAESERPPRVEDEARVMAPVPACITPLPARTTATAGTMRNLREDQYWQLVFPAFDDDRKLLPVDALACTGARVFDDPMFAGGTTRGSPIQVQEGDILYGSGGDRLRILWMRTHKWNDGGEAGPIALVRTKEDFAEVYAIGAYRRATPQTTFQAERVGTEFLVSATDDGCQGLPKTAPCETKVTLFLPRFGKLVPLVAIDTERRAYASGSEPGVSGNIEYRLTASPQYSAAGVSVFEQVKATDSTGRVLRKTELERVMLLHDGKLESSSDSIWGRTYPGGSSAPVPAPAPVPGSASAPAPAPAPASGSASASAPGSAPGH